ncbi:DUF2007 domain-containing protein (plasmid) [Pedobacter sp. BS3]|uniref:putative signal transducing protein n=1 Tax=Pedobacter sp. BS3 TaxID=2567937 RepID=UPI0011ED21D2|nr:DUF2007 domain-containing protein [Pedobacter sp. BS3]TZF85764.1 DUF2007 domain-containing protein [Pedobacter sp. BS3]
MDNHKITPKEIFIGSVWEAEIIQGLLNNAGIDAYVLDESSGTIAPWRVASGGADTVKLVVADDKEQEARQIMSAYRQA